mmetsp:Transcript_9891/g.19074  ORF Transcript_9891/g.19074 Transcript_9891/m.19074 type:complete len:89 (+) Transcript_9891:193-459(+)
MADNGSHNCGAGKVSELVPERAQAREAAQRAPVGCVVVVVGARRSHGEHAHSTTLFSRLTTSSTSTCNNQQSPRCSRKAARSEEEEGE